MVLHALVHRLYGIQYCSFLSLPCATQLNHAVSAVQLAATARWNQCVHCNLSTALPLHQARMGLLAVVVTSPRLTWMIFLIKTNALSDLTLHSSVIIYHLLVENVATSLDYFSYIVENTGLISPQVKTNRVRRHSVPPFYKNHPSLLRYGTVRYRASNFVTMHTPGWGLRV